jgi:hypothetical protein
MKVQPKYDNDNNIGKSKANIKILVNRPGTYIVNYDNQYFIYSVFFIMDFIAVTAILPASSIF